MRSVAIAMVVGRGQWLLRAPGVLFGSASACSARSATFAGGTSPAQPAQERAARFGITLMTVGAISIADSVMARCVDRL